MAGGGEPSSPLILLLPFFFKVPGAEGMLVMGGRGGVGGGEGVGGMSDGGGQMEGLEVVKAPKLGPWGGRTSCDRLRLLSFIPGRGRGYHGGAEGPIRGSSFPQSCGLAFFFQRSYYSSLGLASL